MPPDYTSSKCSLVWVNTRVPRHTAQGVIHGGMYGAHRCKMIGLRLSKRSRNGEEPSGDASHRVRKSAWVPSHGSPSTSRRCSPQTITY
ncbi:Piso0_004696 [Millerozyma farinosa CBS 7064]|uniref:Piso0_004696 protein n=1 Tax=Pichia sorbitophila (strain ATCC MYA-4447 / BCRC 22081 / CBS 7064 / NBRC 10061 / NRRL Y-12695) TaxID=559304 RepID=G8Y9H9_PICSO|nr:Piso0_004696 [Millerozyma farinosa CBS 7064]CCE85124.1 Piso0_004696 [Millerozyma farinosa CBS 7064]